MKRFVTSTEKVDLFGCTQIVSLAGVDQSGEKFLVDAEQASCHIRMGICLYYLWDGEEEYVKLRSVGGAVSESEFSENLNLEALAV